MIRPTEDRVRQALFNMIGTRIEEAVVLDLYAGTGALGLEALSRRASKAVFIDKHPHALGLIHDNLKRLDVLSDQYRVFSGDALQWLNRRELVDEGPFDLIFIDPPYEKGLYQPSLSLIASSGLLKADGWAVLEYSKRHPITPEAPWHCQRSRTYGETTLDIWNLAQ